MKQTQNARDMAMAAMEASSQLKPLSARRRSTIINAMADGLDARVDAILSANALDVADAEQSGMDPSQMDVLSLTRNRLIRIAKSVRAVAALKDPVGVQLSRWLRPNGLEILKVRVPLGVVAMLYECRPAVTSNAVVACVKTCNALILQGQEVSRRTDQALVGAMVKAGVAKGLPEKSIQYVGAAEPSFACDLAQLDGLVDLLIPRGNNEQVQSVRDVATVPLLKMPQGVCHVYVDEQADLDMALAIVDNAKCCRPGTCTAIAAVLVHEAVANAFIPALMQRLAGKGLVIAGDALLERRFPDLSFATDGTSVNADSKLALSVVTDIDQAVRHIGKYGSKLAEVIVTQDSVAAKKFESIVDAAVVYTNASTQFTSGTEFGMGADMGGSTDKLCARGPIGLDDLMTHKFVVRGKGQLA